MGTVVVVHVTGAVVEQLVLGVVFAVLGYLFTQRSRRARGVTPWRIPAAVWAFLLFLSWEIFAVLYLIAYFTTRPRTGPAGWTAGSGQGWAPGPRGAGGPPQGRWSAPPGQAGSGSPQSWEAPAPGSWGPPPGREGAPPPGGWEAPPQPGTAFPGYPAPGSPLAAPGAVTAATPTPPPTPRAWLADPGGRHELRYWDGTKFTEHVADGGKISVDPL